MSKNIITCLICKTPFTGKNYRFYGRNKEGYLYSCRKCNRLYTVDKETHLMIGGKRG